MSNKISFYRKSWFQYMLLIAVALGGFYAFVQSKAESVIVAVPGEPAPSFKLDSLQGEAVALSDYRGRGVALNFWASWCNPCVNELPLLNEAYKLAGFEMIAINVGESAETARKLVDRYELAFPVVLDRERQVMKQYRVSGLPVTVLIDSQGKLIDRHEGELKEMAEIFDLLERLKED